jgi:molybdopterin converting factor small subunit
VQVTVYVPAALRQFAAGERKLSLEVDEPATLGHVFECMHGCAPGVVERTLDELGGVRPHINVFVDGESIRLRNGLQTSVRPGSEVWILPAVSGGQLDFGVGFGFG